MHLYPSPPVQRHTDNRGGRVETSRAHIPGKAGAAPVPATRFHVEQLGPLLWDPEDRTGKYWGAMWEQYKECLIYGGGISRVCAGEIVPIRDFYDEGMRVSEDECQESRVLTS